MKGAMPPNHLKCNYISKLSPKHMSQVTDKEMLNGDTEVTYSCQHLKESYTKQKNAGTVLSSENFIKMKN